MGEVAAAVVSGALSPADGLKVIATRSRPMARLSGPGRDGPAEVSGEDAEEFPPTTPTSVWRSRPHPLADRHRRPARPGRPVIAVVAAQDRLARRVDVDVASHH